MRLTLAFVASFMACGAVLQAASLGLFQALLPTAQEEATATVSVAWPQVTESLPQSGTVTVQPTGSGEPPPTPTVAGPPPLAVALDDFRARVLGRAVLSSAAVWGVMSLAVLAFGWLFAGRVLHPIREFTQSARNIGGQPSSERLPMTGPQDEMFELAATMNAALDRLEEAFRREQRLIAAASHELRTPIANQRTLLEVALRDGNARAEDLTSACQTALSQTIRLDELTDALLTAARAQEASQIRQQVSVDGTISHLLSHTEMDGLRVTLRLEPVSVVSDLLLVERSLQNLLENAVRHNIPGGWIEIETRQGAAAARVVLTNSCRQLAQTDLDDLRAPFRRGVTGAAYGPAPRGYGLGLSIVDQVAQSNGWLLKLHSPTPDSFCAELTIPVGRDGPGPPGAW